MARKKAAAKKSAKKASARTTTPDAGEAIIDAALAIAADGGWSAVTMAAVADLAEIPLGEALLFAPTRAHLLVRFLDRLDASNLAGVTRAGEDGSARDRLFDVLMRRFDLINQKRDGVHAVIKGVPLDPPSAALLACRVGRSAAALLGAAGISAEGLRGFARIQGLKAVMAFALRAWMTDDSDDMTKTMAALDRALSQAERLVNIKSWRKAGDAAAG